MSVDVYIYLFVVGIITNQSNILNNLQLLYFRKKPPTNSTFSVPKPIYQFSMTLVLLSLIYITLYLHNHTISVNFSIKYVHFFTSHFIAHSRVNHVKFFNDCTDTSLVAYKYDIGIT